MISFVIVLGMLRADHADEIMAGRPILVELPRGYNEEQLHDAKERAIQALHREHERQKEFDIL